VVRLRVEQKSRPRAAPTVRRPPLADEAPPAPDDVDVELVPLADEPAEDRWAPPGRWVLALALGGAVLLALAVGCGAGWWFLH
jgi:hypothetical protein